ncbi:MAG TPA: hypothetical protein VNK04_26050 [Gemmataceae bacterium]|nr:hypothetical protein [Gemmataceae bacterium]
MNALANPEVGKYLNEYFCSAFQKVATFRIVNGQKQGGNVAAYFCAPDGRVLHCVAGPVDAATMLREAKWVVETTKKAMAEAKGDGAKFKAFFRKAHADRLRNEHGIVVEAITFDPPAEQDPNSALTYNDPTGRPLAPKLPPPPIDGPDVTLRARELQSAALAAPGNKVLLDRRGGRVALNNQGQVHHLMAAHCMRPIETLYGAIFEGILGEKISTKPVQVVTPFPWRPEGRAARNGPVRN